MIKYAAVLFLACFFALGLSAQDAQMTTPFERSKGLESATYNETIHFYQQLDAAYKSIRMVEVGETDTYEPLRVVYYSGNGKFNINSWHREGKIILLINNGIHPGEPDGIDGCMMLLRDAAEGKITIPDNVVLAVVPVFNIGGMLNRNSYSRANQDGPKAYGFRGSAQNLDLNRDFIKLDAKETRSLIGLFHDLDPDLFIDNHVSDGADYQHIMTLLSTQHDKLGGAVGIYMHDMLEPQLYKDMKRRGYDLVPYVNDFDKTPDVGWTEFYDPPRFSSGFAILFQTFAFVPETHMLKPFDKRVQATYDLMRSFIKIAAKDADAIKASRHQDREAIAKQTLFTLNWSVDTAHKDSVFFKGYTAGYKASEVSGLPRLYYDRDKPFGKYVPFYNHFKPDKQVTAPRAYYIKQGWQDVVKRLEWNGVHLHRLNKDTSIALTVYHIDKYETGQHPYEKHYLHKNVQVTVQQQRIKLLKGDYVVPVDQQAKRYIIETLEPAAPDAFFAWGFFDAILQEKEYYSDYVFEDVAARLLKSDAALREQLQQKRRTDTAFAKSAAAQLDFVYHHSPYYEPEHMRYPVFRLER